MIKDRSGQTIAIIGNIAVLKIIAGYRSRCPPRPRWRTPANPSYARSGRSYYIRSSLGKGGDTEASDLIEGEVGSVDGLAVRDALAGEGEEVLQDGVALEGLRLLHA